MSLKISQILTALLCNSLLLCTVKSSAQESYDPFYLLQNSNEGKQLLDIIQNAEYDADLAQQQLNTLINAGIDHLSEEYQVARILAEIEIFQNDNNFIAISEKLDELHLLGAKKDHDWVLAIYFERHAMLAMRQGKFLKSFEDANRAIEIAESINYQETIAKAKAIRAVMSSKLGKSSDTFQDFMDALAFFEQSNNLKRITVIYSNLVTLYLDRQDYTKALEASDQSIKVLNKLPRASIRILTVNYINRAITLSYLGKKEEELDAYVQAQEYALKSDDAELLASVYANLSDYFLRNNNYTLAIERAMRCIETSNRIDNVNLTAICYLNQGLATVHSNELDQGIALITKAQKLAEAHQMESTLIDVYKAYIEAYQAAGDHLKANQWLETRYQLLLKQAKHDKENSFQKMEESFKETVTERDQLYDSFKHDMMENILGQEALVKRLWMILASLIFLILVAFFVIFRLKKQLKQKYYQ